MLAAFLKILSILGIVLLVLLGILLVLILLILFMPIVYKINALKNETELKANGMIQWLFGLVRVKYAYPEPGTLIVKLLCFTVYDSGKVVVSKSEGVREIHDTSENVSQNKDEYIKKDIKKETVKNTEHTTEHTIENTTHTADDESNTTEQKGILEKLFAKYEKIKYTIKKIYDKIKHILENLSFYRDLFQEQETKQLLSYAGKKLGKVWLHVRPKIKADITFGAASPDTTGYVYAGYGMISYQLGKDVCVTPDFTRQVLQGSIQLKGHITMFTVLINVLAIALDKRLRVLIGRIKAHSKKVNKKHK